MFKKAKLWARSIKTDIVALYIAAKDTRTPLSAKLISVAVVAYALSPIDLIPDFIPVIGYLDDIVIVPLGITLAVYLIPKILMAQFRAMADDHERLPPNRLAAAIVICLWIASMTGFVWWLFVNRGD
ncbi:YkvA family protein [Ahrensia sp. 13_GOM-1096m]|uniref:YkvA family protein n=1 Tax=Ahrensia sp. 13_GOM-1096m TaxID=1380380 RepID=UPI00047D3256|nr:YkvA family protein [Ahrensia sp. 13_GOM-1096m]